MQRIKKKQVIYGGLMFGYFKLDKECPSVLFSQYKKNYCFLCKSISKHYGQLARFTLSYDVAFLLMVVSEETFLDNIKKIHCVKSDTQLKTLLKYKKARDVATVNILLSAAKLEDDIYDENSLSAKIIYMILRKAINKAKKYSPDMWDIISEEYSAIRCLENNNAELEQLEKQFSNMMTRIAKECFGLSDNYSISVLDVASKWLYFIDAVDDIDDNLSDGTFNPFAKYGSFTRLKKGKYIDLINHFNELYTILPYKNNHKTLNMQTIDRVMFWGLPEATVRVLCKQRK